MSGKSAKKARQAARNAPVRYWHGGQPGLTPGTVLVGRDEAAAAGASLTQYDLQEGYALGVTNPGRVYFSSTRDFARGFAARLQIADATTGIVFQHGSLYEVEPIGAVEEDEDFRGKGVSWCAPQARIVAVVEESVDLNPYQSTQLVGPYSAWSDGSPMYSAAGQYLPSPEHRAHGQFPDWLSTLLSWTPYGHVAAWSAGQRAGDRPTAIKAAGVLHEAREAHEVLLRHRRAATELVNAGVQFSNDSRRMLPKINALLPMVSTVTPHDSRGVAFATDAGGEVIAAMVFSAGEFGAHLVMLIDGIAVTPAWRGRGLGSVLLLTAQQMVSGHPALVAGHCKPDAAPFFAQAGFTVLRPGVPMLIPGADRDWKPVSIGSDDAWFFRQGPV